MSSTGGAPTQLELPFVARSLRACVSAYLSSQAAFISDATAGDYAGRAAWVLRELGEHTPIDLVTFDALDRVVSRARRVLKDVTIKKRLVFLRAALKLAHERGQLDRVPALPKLKNDGSPGGAVHTVEQWQVVRQHLPEGWVRDFYDVAFWTGLRLSALFELRRQDLDPERPVLDEKGEELDRGMYLRPADKELAELWIPMQPELRLLAKDILRRTPPQPVALIFGRRYNVHRHLQMAVSRASAATGEPIPDVSPNRLRSSYASMLIGRGYTSQWVRLAMGHRGEYFQRPGDGALRVARPTVGERHYIQPTPALMAQGGGEYSAESRAVSRS